MTRSRSPYYQEPPRGYRSHGLAMPAPQRRYRSRTGRWPPPPTVEDEVVSLSREHSPAVPDLIGGEAQARGAVDQQPLILEANPQSERPISKTHKKFSDDDWRSLRSKSSTDSFGPPTPPESAASITQDRRFVWRPEPGIDIPASYDEPVPKPTAKGRETPLETRDARPRKEPPSLDTSKAGNGTTAKPSPLTSGRASSPYAYSASSGTSTFSGDYLMSPDTLSPDIRFQRRPGDLEPRTNTIHTDRDSSEGRARTSSGNAIKMERPSYGRHKTVPYTEEKSPSIKLPPSPSRMIEHSSDESDLSHEDTVRKRGNERSSRYSFVRTEEPRHAPTIRYDETRQQSRKKPSHAPRPNSPSLRPLPMNWEALPVPDTKVYGSSVPTTAPLHMEAAMRQRGHSPRPSPLPSPHTTPPSSPHPDPKRYSVEHPNSGGRSRPDARPSSPLPSAHFGGLNLPDETRLRNRRPPLPPRSRETSPLPSPEPQSASTRSDYADVYTPTSSNSSRSRTSTLAPEILPRPRETSKSFILGQPPRSQTLGVPPPRRTHAAVDPHDLPTAGGARSPRTAAAAGSLHSPLPTSPAKRAKTPGPPVILPPCPRPHLMEGYTDWSTVQSCPNLDVCPSCRRAIEDAGWEGHFHPSPLRPAGYSTRCDFNDPWVRMAWLLVLQNRDTHLDVVQKVIDNIAKEESCPGRTGAVRNWFRLYDSEANRLISTFDVCPQCVRHLEAIFPKLKGQFIPAQMSNPLQKRTCDLSRESRRFATYVDTLEEVSKQASEYRRAPNMLRFVRLVQKMANTRECTRDNMVLGQPWHFISHLPEFTVCEECYDAVVWPELSAGSELAANFNRTLQLLPPSAMGTSCQLYSQRMRDMFLSCCRRNDRAGLRQSVLQRVRVERDLQGRLAKVRMYGGGDGPEEVGRLVEEWRRWE